MVLRVVHPAPISAPVPDSANKSATGGDKRRIPFAEALEEDCYDIAFVDAPYGSKKLDRIVNHWADCQFARVLGVEHARDQVLPHPELRGRTRFHGDTGVTIYRADVVSGLRATTEAG